MNPVAKVIKYVIDVILDPYLLEQRREVIHRP